MPVVKTDGSLFGTLCAIDPKLQRDSIIDDLPLVELFAKLLGTILERDLTAIDQSRKLEHSLQDALLDGLTGLLNRKGWDNHIVTEEARAIRYGMPLSIFIVDLDDLKNVNDSEGHAHGDALIRKTASCLQTTLRSSDIIARIGGDEFAILAIDCNKGGTVILSNKITSELARNNIRASIWSATREPGKGLSAAIVEADLKMYSVKAERRLPKSPIQHVRIDIQTSNSISFSIFLRNH